MYTKNNMAKSIETEFLNSELCWLEFNNRVLHEAEDPRTPLLERLKFIAIVSNNLDEFAMKRLALVLKQCKLVGNNQTRDGLTYPQLYEAMLKKIHEMVVQQRNCLLHKIIPELRTKGIYILEYNELSDSQKEFARQYYEDQIEPVLTPLAIDLTHPFPFISNLSLNLLLKLRSKTDGIYRYARLKIPGNRPRWIPLNEPDTFIPIEQIITQNLENIFPGDDLEEVFIFRITRSAFSTDKHSDLDITPFDWREPGKQMEVVEELLESRRFAFIVRVETNSDMPESIRKWLSSNLKIELHQIHFVDGPLGLNDLLYFMKLNRIDLKDKPWVPITHPALKAINKDGDITSIFDVIKKQDILLHHPYHNFDTSVLRLIEEAADDTQVLAIKQTLYRTAVNSPIVHALIRAAENGKQVACLVELTARFDEAANIQFAELMDEAGIHVCYGVSSLKTHAKCSLIVRAEGNNLNLYAHIGTGNYHTGTAKLYTDLGLLTSNKKICREVASLFNSLTGHSKHMNYKHILVAPNNMRDRFQELINREIGFVKQGKTGHIICKMNQLEDTEIIRALYKASNAGVKIQLIVRGYCCLRPGVKGLSENIEVTSIIGRFLEHHRIFWFSCGSPSDQEVYIGSGDWMERNLSNRVELATPIKDPGLVRYIKKLLSVYLIDNRQSWVMNSDGTYFQKKPKENKPIVSSQEKIMSFE